MHLSHSTLLALIVGCGGGFKTAGDCEDGYKRADDGNCYPSGLDDDTGTSSDGDGDVDGDGGPGDGDGDSDGGPPDGDGDSDGGPGDGDGDSDGGPPDGDGDSDGGPPDGDGDSDGGPPDDADADADGGPSVEDGDCSTTISGLSSVAWAASGNVAMLIGIPSGDVCTDAIPLGDYRGTLMFGLITPYEAGTEGEFLVTGEIIDEPSIKITYVEAPDGGGMPTEYDLDEGTFILSTPAMPEGGLFGNLSASGSGMTLTGDFSACWCDAMVAEVETILEE